MKKLKFIILIITFIFFISCIDRVYTIKIRILDENKKKIFNAIININGNDIKIENDEEIELKLKEGEYKIYIEKENFFPYENTIFLNKNLELNVELVSIENKKSELIEKIFNKIKNSKKFDIQFIGNMNGTSENFNASIDLESNIYILNSNLLKKDLIIKKVDNSYFFNDKEIPEDIKDYFPQIINIISESILFVKNLPTLIKDYDVSLRKKYITISFISFNENLRIQGYIISDLNLNIKNEQINIKAIDEMKRINEFFINIYNLN